MPNHVHLVLTPSSEDGLRAALAEAHRRYSRRINQREGWTGYLRQDRFASAPTDEAHLMATCDMCSAILGGSVGRGDAGLAAVTASERRADGAVVRTR